MNAFEATLRQDFRKLRANQLTAAFINEINDLLPAEVDIRKIHDRIFHMMYINGYAWTSDEERVRMGFESRDQFGWTQTEKQKADALKEEAALAMCSRILKPDLTDI